MVHFSRRYHADFAITFTPTRKGAPTFIGVGIIMRCFGINRRRVAPFICIAPTLTTFGARRLEISTVNSAIVRFLERGVEQ